MIPQLTCRVDLGSAFLTSVSGTGKTSRALFASVRTRDSVMPVPLQPVPLSECLVPAPFFTSSHLWKCYIHQHNARISQATEPIARSSVVATASDVSMEFGFARDAS